jgi:hypothetical protein
VALDVQISISKARIREGSLRQHAVHVFPAGAEPGAPSSETIVLATALSAPRLWGFMLDAALAGFEEGLARPSDGRASTRLHQAFDGAQRRVRTRAESLIEKRMPDVGLLALALDGRILHVLCLGPARAYLQRRRSIRRLSPRDDRAEGVLKAAPTWCAEETEPGDLLMAGSLTAFSEQALGPVRTQIEGGFALPPRKVVEDLNKLAAAQGLGAAAIAFRLSNY